MADDTQQNEEQPEPSAGGRDKSTESTPTASGHSTADTQAERNQEDESPG